MRASHRAKMSRAWTGSMGFSVLVTACLRPSTIARTSSTSSSATLLPHEVPFELDRVIHAGRHVVVETCQLQHDLPDPSPPDFVRP